MPRLFAFLRAINVGGHVVKMEDLRSMFHSMGFINVETYIASGNVIFQSKSTNTKSLERKIENQLYNELGFEVATFIRTGGEISSIAKYKPFPDDELKSAGALNIAFQKDPLDVEETKRLVMLRTEIDDFHVHGREVYWLCRKKQSGSKFSNVVFERRLGVKTTFRGVNTIAKLAARYSK